MHVFFKYSHDICVHHKSFNYMIYVNNEINNFKFCVKKIARKHTTVKCFFL